MCCGCRTALEDSFTENFTLSLTVTSPPPQPPDSEIQYRAHHPFVSNTASLQMPWARLVNPLQTGVDVPSQVWLAEICEPGTSGHKDALVVNIVQPSMLWFSPLSVPPYFEQPRSLRVFLDHLSHNFERQLVCMTQSECISLVDAQITG